MQQNFHTDKEVVLLKFLNSLHLASVYLTTTSIQVYQIFAEKFLNDFYLKKIVWQRWDPNPRHRNDWCLKPTP